MSIKSLYKEKMPFYIPVTGEMFRKKNRQYTDFLKLSENWDYEKIESWQLQNVRQIVDFAFENIPFYQREYKKAGYTVGGIDSWNDFKQLPYVTKNDIKSNLKDFLPKDIEHFKGVSQHTGGSTDKPMMFYLDRDILTREDAFFEYYWGKYGYSIGERCIILRGNHIAGTQQDRIFSYDRIRNYKIFDSGYISRANLNSYDRQIRNFHADFMQAYPSSIFSLARAYDAEAVEPPHFKCIFLGSENTYQDQIKYIESIFKPDRIMYHYGHSECAALALKYPDCDRLGFLPQYGYTELEADKGKLDSENVGEIVATSFNHSTPFIRYRTGDYAVASSYQSSDFMKNCLSVERIEGRKQEYVITKSKRIVSLCNIAGAHMPSLSLIGDMQYEQNMPGLLTVYITRAEGGQINDGIIKAIDRDFYSMFQKDMEIKIIPVEKIEKTVSGKRLMIKQHLDIESFR